MTPILYVTPSGKASGSPQAAGIIAHAESRRVSLAAPLPMRVIHHIGDDQPAGIVWRRDGR